MLHCKLHSEGVTNSVFFLCVCFFVDSSMLLSDFEGDVMFSSRERLEGNDLGLASVASHLIVFILSL